MPGPAAGIVLAGGRSSRMGTPKAALEWHGSTLLRRTVGVISRVTDGPIVVVRASGQDLPALPADIEVVDDPRAGIGPIQGLATGLAAIAGRAEFAFVSATDMPFLHPAFVRQVLRATPEGADVGLPIARGYAQPLAACYRQTLARVAERLVTENRLRPAFLFEESVVSRLDEGALRADPVLAELDPGLDSLINLNEPADYLAARARPAPEVIIQRCGVLAADDDRPELVRAATVAAAAAAAGLEIGPRVLATLDGDQIVRDGQTPLATGDRVFFVAAAVAHEVIARRLIS
jgi:molybdopterin-guanine dinucleotide biosynthesis protein A